MIGKQLLHYEVTEKLGAGGMGEVYLARDSKLGREVAIKLLHTTFGDDEERIARFQREASLLASLNHQNIATIHGLEQDGDSSFIVMELVPGEDLATAIKRGPMPVSETIDVCKQIAQSLAVAHDKGVVHRDLKPGNVRVTPEGIVKVLDFGLAKAMDAGPEPSDTSQSPTIMSGGHTAAGVILGTAAYMSPEQARGKPVDERTDVWSFGCVMYECLIGDIPFKGETVTDMLAKILERDPDWSRLPANISPGLKMLLRRCLEKDPKKRWRSFNDIAVLLDEVATLPEATASAAAPTPARRRIGPFLISVPLIIVAAAVSYMLGARGGESGTAAPTGLSTPTMTYEQLTVDNAQELDPSFSPDGNFVVYTSGEQPNTDIFLHRVGGQKPINLTEHSDDGDYSPEYSPDGSQIAFRSERGGGGIFLMGSTGESVRRLTNKGYSPSWSPDGTKLVVCDEYNSQPYGRQLISKLYVVDVASGELTVIFEGDAVDPVWSPNGHRIAFWGIGIGDEKDHGQRDIFTVRADGTDVTYVTNDAYVDWYPVWSPDGKHLYFASTRSGSMNLWRAPIDEETGELTGPTTPLTAPTSNFHQFALSGDGKRVAFVAHNPGVYVNHHEFDLERRTVSPPVNVVGSSLNPGAARISPDGNWITFRSGTSQEDLMICRTDGTDIRKLTDDLHKDRGPSWSPDGERIIWYTDRSGRYEIHSIQRDGSDMQQITTTEGRSLWFPLYSPDGTKIAATNDEGGRILDVTGAWPVRGNEGERLPFPAEGRLAWVYDWIDEGTLMCGLFNPARSTMEGVVVYDIASKTFTQTWPIERMTNAAHIDGDHALMLGGGQLSLLHLLTGEEEKLMDAPHIATSFGLLTPAPDGSAILIGGGQADSDIWIATVDE